MLVGAWVGGGAHASQLHWMLGWRGGFWKKQLWHVRQKMHFMPVALGGERLQTARKAFRLCGLARCWSAVLRHATRCILKPMASEFRAERRSTPHVGRANLCWRYCARHFQCYLPTQNEKMILLIIEWTKTLQALKMLHCSGFKPIVESARANVVRPRTTEDLAPGHAAHKKLHVRNYMFESISIRIRIKNCACVKNSGLGMTRMAATSLWRVSLHRTDEIEAFLRFYESHSKRGSSRQRRTTTQIKRSCSMARSMSTTC